MRNKINKNGFTLIEISLYFCIIAILMLGILSFSGSIFNLSNKSNGMQEITENLDYISQKITSTAKFSEGINTGTSIFLNDTGAISFLISSPPKSPTTFNLQNGSIFIKEGNSAQEQISSDKIICLKFRFELISANKTPDSISYEITCKPDYEDPQNILPEITIRSQISLIDS